MRLLYFAWVRERIGKGEEDVCPPAEIKSVADLIDWLAGQGEPYASAFAERERLRAAVDGVFASINSPVAAAREVAIFPPVTGG